jgi:hypothetical protein
MNCHNKESEIAESIRIFQYSQGRWIFVGTNQTKDFNQMNKMFENASKAANDY